MTRPAPFHTLLRLIPALLTAWLLSGCSLILFQPSDDFSLTPDILDIPYEEITVTSGFNTLHGWHLKAQEKERRGTVLFFHGNAGNISVQLLSVFWFPKYGYDVIMFDYSGYGKSEGFPGIERIHRDGKVMLEWAVKHAPQEEPLYLFAQSLGGSVATYSLVHSPDKSRFAMLILDSTFSSYKTLAKEALAEKSIPWLYISFDVLIARYERFSQERFIDQVAPVPLIIIHGSEDELVLPSHALTLESKAKEPKELWIIDGAEHIKPVFNPGVRKRLIKAMQKAAQAHADAP